MIIYTSYFANVRKLAASGIKPMSISLYPPRYFQGTRLYNVAPTKSILFAKNQTHEQYTQRYINEVLSKIDAKTFVEQLECMSGGMDVALCCFEVPSAFCHRHILADWLHDQLGIDVKEWNEMTVPDPVEEKHEPKQLSLFGDD